MKKLVATFVGLIIVGIFATSVSAEDYEVQKGDNLWNIANDNNITVEVLMDINELDSSMIHPEQVLKLEENENEYYVVEQGDTLIDISEALEDDVSVGNLMAWNDLPSDLIITGEKLIVNGEENEEKLAITEVSEPKIHTANANKQKVETKAKVEPKKQEKPAEQAEGRTFSVVATAYTAGCSGCSGITATGVNLNSNPNAKVIAVDPNVIPLGTEVYVEGYGYAVAADTGGAIKGNKIDIHVPTKDQAYSWGRRTVNITVLE